MNTLKSYYNAVNRKEYERAYSYFSGAPNPRRISRLRTLSSWRGMLIPPQ